MTLRFARGLAVLVCAVSLVAGAASHAQKAPAADPDRLAAARELLDATGSAKQFEAALPMLVNQIQGLFLQMKPAAEKDIREVFVEMAKRFSDRKQEVFDEIAVLYAQKLSAEELRQIAAFFKSGVGAKFVTLQPELVQQSMLIGQRWGQKIGQEVEADVRKELKKRGIDL